MKQFSKNTSIVFNPEIYKDLLDPEKTIRIYTDSLMLPKNIDYRDIVLKIIFKNTNNIPNTIQIYCFNPSTKVEKGIIAVFSFLSHTSNSLYQKQKSNKLIVDLYPNVDNINFHSENDYQIDRIGFHIDNIKSNILFNCQVFTKDIKPSQEIS